MNVANFVPLKAPDVENVGVAEEVVSFAWEGLVLFFA